MANKRSELAGWLGFWVSWFLGFSVSQFQWFSPPAGSQWSPLLRALLVLFGFEKLWVFTVLLQAFVRVFALSAILCMLCPRLVGPFSGLLPTDSGRVIRAESKIWQWLFRLRNSGRFIFPNMLCFRFNASLDGSLLICKIPFESMISTEWTIAW